MLIRQLQSSSSYFFIHIDAKSNINDFVVHTVKHKNITFLKSRYKLNWGGFGIIRASIALMKALEISGLEYSHAHLLSGEDISLKSPDQVAAFFSENIHNNYLNYNKLPYNRWAYGGMDRISRYYFGQNNRNEKKTTLRLLHVLDLIINDLLPRLIPAQRKRTTLFTTFYGGSGWWSLNRHTVGWLLAYFKSHPKALRFFKTVYIPIECTFHTILINSELKKTVCNDNKRYIDWSRSKMGSPTVFDELDYIMLKESNKFFARKIDFEKGRRLYEMFS